MKLRSITLLGVLGTSSALAIASCSGSSDNPFADGGPGDGAMMTDRDVMNVADDSAPCPGTWCSGQCVDTQTDNSNCGMCGKTCGMKEQCSAGACVSCTMIDKDKDGFNACDDCDDADPMVNPGAFEVQGNGKDDNCDGKMDEIVQCDMGLTSDSMSAQDMAKAIDICDPGAMASYPTLADNQAHQIAPDWGMVFKPQFGASMGALSTGIAADADDTKPLFTMNTPQPGTDFMKSGTPFPVTPTSYQCMNTMHQDPMTAFDYTEFDVKLKVPTNAKSFAIDVNYLTSEWPESVCLTTYDDVGFILLDSQAYKGNIAVGGKYGRALSVNSGLITQTTAQQLAGTGMDKVVGNSTLAGGATGWMTMEAPVVPGETITLRFIVLDAVDGLYDTQLLIDHFRWQTKNVCAPNTQVLGDAGVDAGGPMCPDGGVMDAGGQ